MSESGGVSDIQKWVNQPRNAAILGVVFVLVVGGYFAFNQMSRRSLANDAIAQALQLAQDIGPKVQEFEKTHHRVPFNNGDLGLPVRNSPSWAPLSVVEVRADGSIYFEYATYSGSDESDPAFMWRLRDSDSGRAGTCAAQRVEQSVLDSHQLQCDTKLDSQPPLPSARAVAAAAGSGAAQTEAETASVTMEHLDVKRDVVQADYVFSAIGHDDDAALDKLKAAGTDICAANPEGRLPLAEAARSGQMKTLAALIAAPCPVQQVEPSSQLTALISATSLKAVPSVDALLAARADPNFSPPGKALPWSLLGDSEDPLTMRLRESLRAHGANLDIAAADGTTLLIRAIDQDSLELVRWLIGKGANLNIQDKKGRSAVMHAVLNPNGDKLLTLLITAHADLNLRDMEDYTALGRVMLIPDAQRQKDLKQQLTKAGARG